MFNYDDLPLEEQKIYDAFADEIQKLRGAAVYDCNEPYVELKKCAYKYKNEIKSIILKYGYRVTNETESEGSDYTAYYIWFDKE